MKKSYLIFFSLLILSVFSSASLSAEDIEIFWPMNNADKMESSDGKYVSNSMECSRELVPNRFGRENSAIKRTGESPTCKSFYSFTNENDLKGWTQGTWNLWINTENWVPGIARVYMAINEVGYGYDTIFLADQNGDLEVTWQNNEQEYLLTSNFNLNSAEKNKWYMITFAWDSSGRKIYINGIENVSDNIAIMAGSANRSFYVAHGNSPQEIYSIDDIRIYNRALENREILALYNQIPVCELSLEELEERIVILEQKLSELESKMQGTDEDIISLKNKYEEQSVQIGILENKINEQSVKTDNLEDDNKEQGEEIINLGNENQEQSELIINLGEENNQQDEKIINLGNENQEQGEEIINLGNENQEQSELIINLGEENQEQDEKINKLNEKISILDSLINKIIEFIKNLPKGLSKDFSK